jgi:hypothetical protein
MSLVIRFSSGESVTIGGVAFSIEWNPPSLVCQGQSAIPLGDDPVSPLPGVQVRLFVRQRPCFLAVAFDAPRGVVILRQASGDIQ